MDAPPRPASPAAADSRGSRRTIAADPRGGRWTIAAVTLLAASLLLPGLGAIDLWAPDEPRYAQVAEELRASGLAPADIVLLRLNGEVYTQKPPLYFWSAALAGAPGDRVDEIAARLPSALAGVAVAVLTALFGRLTSGRWTTGFLAASVVLTMPRFAHQARRAQLDVLLTAFEVVSLLAYWRIDSRGEGEGSARRRWLAILHGAVGLALLTKGPVGALPWLVIVVHRFLTHRGSTWRRLFPAWGVALAILPVSIWALAAIAWAAPGYWQEAIVDNLFARFFAGTDHVRPFHYFALQLPLDALPWTPVMIVGAIQLWRDRGRSERSFRAGALLLAWTLVFVVFFSLSAGKRGLYMLPLFPGLALLAAHPLTGWLDEARVPRAFTLSAVCALFAIAIAAIGATLHPPRFLSTQIADWPRGAALLTAWVALVGAGSILATRRARHRATVAIATVIASIWLFETIAFQRIFPALDHEKSPRPIARLVAESTSRQEPVGVFRHSAFSGGLEYYANRRVVALESARAVDGFVASGARLVVVRERDLPTLTTGRPHRVVGAARSGRRRLLVVELSRPTTPDRA